MCCQIHVVCTLTQPLGFFFFFIPLSCKSSVKSELTLQAVEDGKEVHEGQVHRSPGEKGKAPGEAQQEGYPCDAAHILQHGAVLRVVWVLPLDPTQLDQHHDEHDEVEKENDTEIGHHSYVEGNVIFQPAA